ncbi:MAG: prephenate dehydrogenase/arogenate dehydrogenase family protein [Solirubrobacterales bacterium]
MRLAVLGVGLIGGSIGLAARARVDAEVAGYDPDRETAERAVERGALGVACGSVTEAVDGAEVVFCAAPVGVLSGLVVEALDGSPDDAVVTDVGSTKRGLIAGLPEGPSRERFIGGHPLAGAETSGIDHARADLFEGARWYLVPTERSSGLLYDRLHRTIAELGARPEAVDAETHDRMMATVSHLPHVIANVLAAGAAATLGSDTERLPDVGPSFRDTTRVAGANPAIWVDIFASNREALAGEIDSAVDRLRRAAELLRAEDGEGLAEWHRAALADRRRLLEAELVGGPLCELRVSVQNRPGTVAEIALALGRAGVNIEDMALYPAADMRSGAVSVWVAGADVAERAAGVMRDLGHTVSVISSG